MSDELCGRCKKPIQPGDVREYYGWYMTHRPTECVRLLESEVSRLLERIDALCEESVSFSTQCDDLRAQCDDLRAENEALRQDAERYRWVREPRKGIDVLSRKSGDDRWYYRYGKDLDEYIDSDMARKSER